MLMRAHLHTLQQGLHPLRHSAQLLLRVHSPLAVLKGVAVVLHTPLGQVHPWLLVYLLQQRRLLLFCDEVTVKLQARDACLLSSEGHRQLLLDLQERV